MVRPVADSSRPHFFYKIAFSTSQNPCCFQADSTHYYIYAGLAVVLPPQCSLPLQLSVSSPFPCTPPQLSQTACFASPNSLFCFPKRPVLLPQTGCLGYQSGLRRKSPTFRLFCNPPASCCCFATCVTLVLAASPGHGPGHGRWRVANPPQRGRECEPQSGGGSASREVGRARVSHNV